MFFHRCVQKRRKVNEILGLNFEGELVEEVQPLRDKIRGFFEDHFKGDMWDRPCNIRFSELLFKICLI